MISLFTAIEIPQLLRSQLTALQYADDGAWDANWVPAENFHITIAYIGQVEEPLAAEIDGELARIRAGGFEARMRGVNAFGGAKPQMMHAVVEPSHHLSYLNEKTVTILRRLGVKIERARYVPHVTLARPRHAPPERVQRWIAANNLFDSGPFPVDRFVLFSSHKMGDGRHYEPERDYPLGPALI
ncbi:MAG: RNA 2',3'-cyclic phosphodiesterase [Micropepsaceae bacterium]